MPYSNSPLFQAGVVGLENGKICIDSWPGADARNGVRSPNQGIPRYLLGNWNIPRLLYPFAGIAVECPAHFPVFGRSSPHRPGMTLIWTLICVPLLVGLTPVQARAATPMSSATEASSPAKATAKAKAQSKAQSKAQPKAQSKAQPKAQSKAQPKVQSKPKPKAVAKVKPQVAEAKSRAATPGSQTKATKSASPEKSSVSVDQSAPQESTLDADTAAARHAVIENPGNIAARERLARITVTRVDELLRAEAVGDIAKVGELVRKLTGELHDTGWRVQKMAQGGDLMARQATGFLLERGLLLEKDANRSCADFLIAAEQLASSGWHAAQCQMKVSPDRAWIQMERAAVRGHAAAQESMGRRCLGEFGATAPDYVCARTWLAQSASQGRSRSQTLLAYLMMNGHGGAVDESRATRLYRLAADQGDADAQNNLGEINEMGRGAAANTEEALRWYQLAADQGLASAQFNAGRLLAIGAGDKRDPARARALLLQAEGNGITQARQVISWLDRQNPPLPLEPAAPTSMTVLPGGSKRE
jgi:TPR repeat protein